jgi:hypothetical protein
MFVLCIRTVGTLEPNRLYIRNQHDQKVQHWPFNLPKSGQWVNYRRKGYAVNAFFMEKFLYYRVCNPIGIVIGLALKRPQFECIGQTYSRLQSLGKWFLSILYT